MPQGSTFLAPRARRREVPEDLDVRPALPLHLDARRQLEPDQLGADERRPTPCRARAARSRAAWRSSAPRRASTAASSATATSAYSHIDARNINALADSLEIVHSRSGYNFKQNFFGQTYNPHTGVYNGPQNETGTVDNIGFQYTFSFGALARYPEDWWGDGPDLVLTAFGLLSIVDSPASPYAIAHATVGRGPGGRLGHEHQEAEDGARRASTRRSTGWASTAASTGCSRISTPPTRARRATRAAAISSFAALTLRLLFRTQFVTHETVQLQYAHYWLGDAAYPSYPYAWVAAR